MSPAATPRPRLQPALRVSLIYALFGSLYVLLGDVGVASFAADPDTALIVQHFKGGLFVLISASIIYYLVHRELRERQEAEHAAREAQRLETVARLAGGVAHEFNNVLTTVLGHAALLADFTGAPGERARHADELRQAVERATRLTRQLVLFSGTQVTQPALVRLGPVLQELRGVLVDTLENGVGLEMELADDLWPVWCDVAQIQQLVLNLLANAREASTSGTIRIVGGNVRAGDADAPGQWVRLVVSDEGVGMSPETLAHAFDPFFTTRDQGAGLGLATVHGIVRHFGGRIAIESDPGRGTTVEVLLPRGREQPGPGSAPAAPAPATLMVVEDDVAVRELTVRILRRQGHEVLAACDAAEALQIADARPDVRLVIADIVMPGMNGIELAHRLRRTRPDLPVLFTSGYTRGSLGDTADFDARTWFMEKPYRPDELLARVSAALTTTT